MSSASDFYNLVKMFTPDLGQSSAEGQKAGAGLGKSLMGGMSKPASTPAASGSPDTLGTLNSMETFEPSAGNENDPQVLAHKQLIEDMFRKKRAEDMQKYMQTQDTSGRSPYLSGNLY